MYLNTIKRVEEEKIREESLLQGLKLGKQEERLKSIKMFVESMKKFGVSQTNIINELIEKCKLNDNEIQQFIA